MESFVVSHTAEGEWLVSRDGQRLALCPNEEKALLVTVALASQRKLAGAKAAIVIMQEAEGKRRRRS
jgi:hypothetical protein